MTGEELKTEIAMATAEYAIERLPAGFNQLRPEQVRTFINQLIECALRVYDDVKSFGLAEEAYPAKFSVN